MGSRRQLKTEPLPEPKLKIRSLSHRGNCVLLSQKRKSSGGLTSRGIPCFSPPKLSSALPLHPTTGLGSGSPSLTRCRAAPRLRRPAAAVWHRPTPSPRSPTFFRTPRPCARPRGVESTSVSHLLSRGRSGARHALPQSHRLEQRARPGRQTAARGQRSRSSSPPPLSSPWRRPRDPAVRVSVQGGRRGLLRC